MLAVSGSDLAGLDDEAIFRTAVRERRILVTYDIGGLVFVDSKTISTSEVSKLARALRRLSAAIQRGEVEPAGGIFLSSK